MIARVLLLVGLVGCVAVAPQTPPPPPAPVAAEPVLERVELPAEHGLRTVERWVGGAKPGDDVPTVVALHGLGDSPERFAWIVDGLDQPTRVVLPAGPTPFGDGHAWMTIRTAEGRPDELAAQVAAAASRVAALCRDLSRDGDRPVLTGFSQGGMVAWTVAARHPESIEYAVPIAGYLPTRLVPPAGLQPAPIFALHGDADSVVPLRLAEQGRDALAAMGFRAELQVFPGVAHVVPPAMRRALSARLTIEPASAAPRAQPLAPAAP